MSHAKWIVATLFVFFLATAGHALTADELEEKGSVPALAPLTAAESEQVSKLWQSLIDHEALKQDKAKDLATELAKVRAARLELLNGATAKADPSLYRIGLFLDNVAKETKQYLDTYAKSSMFTLLRTGFREKVMGFIYRASAAMRFYLEKRAKMAGQEYPAGLAGSEKKLHDSSLAMVTALGDFALVSQATVKKELAAWDRKAAQYDWKKLAKDPLFGPLSDALADIKPRAVVADLTPAGDVSSVVRQNATTHD